MWAYRLRRGIEAAVHGRTSHGRKPVAGATRTKKICRTGRSRLRRGHRTWPTGPFESTSPMLSMSPTHLGADGAPLRVHGVRDRRACRHDHRLGGVDVKGTRIRTASGEPGLCIPVRFEDILCAGTLFTTRRRVLHIKLFASGRPCSCKDFDRRLRSVADTYDNALAENTIGLYKADRRHSPSRKGSLRTMSDIEGATSEWGVLVQHAAAHASSRPDTAHRVRSQVLRCTQCRSTGRKQITLCASNLGWFTASTGDLQFARRLHRMSTCPGYTIHGTPDASSFSQ